MFLKRIMKDIIAFISLLFPRQKRASVLMYHSIGNDNTLLAVKLENFKKQMKYLKDNNYRVISLNNLVEILKTKKDLPKKTIVLTFDDGFENNYINAFSVLKEYNFPVTIFLTVGSIGEKVVTSQGNFPALNWDEIKEMHDSGLIDFQPHTMTHPKLDQITLKEIKLEIIQSKKIIEEKLNKKCYFFAPPKGRFSQEIKEVLKVEGFKAVLTIEKGLIKKNDDLFSLKRRAVNSTTSFIQFKANL